MDEAMKLLDRVNEAVRGHAKECPAMNGADAALTIHSAAAMIATVTKNDPLRCAAIHLRVCADSPAEALAMLGRAYYNDPRASKVIAEAVGALMMKGE